MATRTPARGLGTRIAREGSEDVVPGGPGTASRGEEEEPVIDTLKTVRKKRGRQSSRARVDVRAGTVSEAEEMDFLKIEEQLTVKKPGRGGTGKGEEVEQQLPTKTPARGRPRKNSRPARSKPIEPNQGLPDDDDDKEEEEARPSTLFNSKPFTRKPSKVKEPMREPELDTLEEDAAGPSYELNQDEVIPTTATEVQQLPVKATLAQVQQAVRAVSQPADQRAKQSLSSWIFWALQFVLLLAIVTGISFCGYTQFLEIYSTIDARVKTVEQQLVKVMNTEIPILIPEPRRVDWFSFGLGALPITNLCTPSYHIPPPPPPKKTWFWSKPVAVQEIRENRLRRLEAERLVSPLNASQALLHWDEPSPRYCVRALDKLQLAVFTPRPITPTELVIEDFHKDETLRIATAPRDVELWMSTQTPGDRQLLNAQITENHRHIRAIRSTRTPGRDTGPNSASLTADWIPIGRWRYNIYAEDNIQKFPIELEMGDVNSRNFAVRVINNWGDNELICLVRARLYGIDRSKVRERLLPERILLEGKKQVVEDSK